ncbi:MAG: hypothetical protein AB2392_20160 [Neobacillus sp.]
MKKIIILFFIVILLLGYELPVIALASENNNSIDQNVVRVELFSDEDKIIFAEVHESYEAEYLDELNNIDFKNAEINNSLKETVDTSSIFRIQSYSSLSSYSTPSTQVKYFGLNEALTVLNHMDSTTNWGRLFSNPFSDAVATSIIALFAKSNFYASAAVLTTWSAADLSNRQQDWWEKSVLMLYGKEITGVKLTVTPNNTGSNYPAAYITLERYKQGWFYENTNWYFYKESLKPSTGWLYDSGKWYFLNSTGAMATGWIYTGEKWYYLDSSGVMQTGWVRLDSKWYYLNNSGVMQTGWIYVNGSWYYLNSSGVMQTGWIYDNGYWYFLYSNGVMAKNTTIDGYIIGTDGKRMGTTTTPPPPIAPLLLPIQ